MTQTSSIGGGCPALTDREDRQLRQACRDLEEVFMRYVVREMGLLAKRAGGGPGTAGSAQYGALAEEALASALTDAGGLGLADTIYSQLKEAAAEAAREVSQSTPARVPDSPTAARDRLHSAPVEDRTVG